MGVPSGGSVSLPGKIPYLMSKNQKQSLRTLREYEITLTSPSGSSDIECADGEVAVHTGIPWLLNRDTLPDGAGTSSGASSSGAADAGFSPIPEGTRLLAVHSPEHRAASKRYVYMDSHGLIGVTPGAESLYEPVGFWPRALGTLRQTVPYGNILTLIGTSGMGWMTLGSYGRYSLRFSLPEPPEVSYTMMPAHLEGYTRMAGSRPSLTVEVGFKESEEISADDLAGWLTAGDSSAVGVIFRRRILQGVADAVERYVADARRAGLWLMPARCVVSYGGAVPGVMTVADPGYAPPSARLEEWKWSARTLTMTLSLSLRPMSLTAAFTATDSQADWQEVFPEVWFAVAGDSGFSSRPDGRVEATALTAIVGEEARSFRFASLTAEDALRRAGGLTGFQTVARSRPHTVLTQFVNLPCPLDDDAPYTPDYTDAATIYPRGAALTDEGVILYGGYRHTSTPEDEEGHDQPLEDSLLAPEPGIGGGVVYRHLTRVSDSRLAGVVQMSGSKGKEIGARHPLCAVSADGVRLLTADGSGAYRNTRLVSRLGALEREGADVDVYPVPDGARFHSAEGVAHVSLGGTVTIIGPLPEEEAELPPDLTGSLVAGGSPGCYLLTRPLKLGSAFGRESLREAEAPVPGVLVTVEGSDDLSSWTRIARGASPLRGVYAPCFRYLRVALFGPTSAAGMLRSVRLVTRRH